MRRERKLCKNWSDWWGTKRGHGKSWRTAAVLLLMVVVMTVRPVMEVWAGGIQWKQYKDTRLEIDSRNPAVNQPFAVSNMFPGDVLAQEYEVEVTHKGSILMNFHATVRPGYEKLAEVLNIRVETEGQVFYDGLMAQMPESVGFLVQRQTSRAVVTPVDYKLTVYLDTSVENDYQNKNLIADFEWWVQVEEQDDDSQDSDDDSDSGQSSGTSTGAGDGPGAAGQTPGQAPNHALEQMTQPSGRLAYLPKTGDITVWSACALLISGLAYFLILLLGKRRKEEEDAN